MRKYKLYAGFLSVAMACSLIMPVSAEDYSDTEAWYASVVKRKLHKLA